MTETENVSRELLHELKSLKKSRRRKFFFKLIFIFIAIAVVGVLLGKKEAAFFKPHVALVQLKGVIGEDQDIEAAPVMEALQTALNNDLSVGVILEINSPGGSPVQSALIYDEIRSLRKKHVGKNIHCMVTDIAASGGYYVASACEKIFANRASLVGSIGVVLSGLYTFGFTKAMEHLGIERRMMTAGKHKSFLDPFSPVDKAEQDHIQAMLDNLHAEFIADVKNGRGTKLKNTDEIFTGLIWSGKKALELGLIDGFSSRTRIAKDQFNKTNIYDYTPKKNPFDEFVRLSGALSDSLKLIKKLTGS